MLLALLAASLLTLAPGFLDRTSASDGMAPQGPAKSVAAIPFSATELVNPKRGQFQDINIPLYPSSKTSTSPGMARHRRCRGPLPMVTNPADECQLLRLHCD